MQLYLIFQCFHCSLSIPNLFFYAGWFPQIASTPYPAQYILYHTLSLRARLLLLVNSMYMTSLQHMIHPISKGRNAEIAMANWLTQLINELTHFYTVDWLHQSILSPFLISNPYGKVRSKIFCILLLLYTNLHHVSSTGPKSEIC